MNFLKNLFSVKRYGAAKPARSSVKPQDVDDIAYSSLPEAEKLSRFFVFLEDPKPEVRMKAIWKMRPLSQYTDDHSEEQVITRLGGLVRTDPDEEVRRQAIKHIITLLRGSQSFGYVSNRYPMAVEAIVVQLKSSKQAADSTIDELRMGTPKFHTMFRFSPSSGELISILGEYARDDQNSKENRNGAAIILGRLTDLRAKDFLQSLTNEKDVYIQINVRQSLQQIEPVEGVHRFSLDGWNIERYAGNAMNDIAQTTGIAADEKNMRLIYAFNLTPDTAMEGRWGVYGSWPCPQCGGSISFGLTNLLNPEGGNGKGSCYPQQDYSIVLKYRGREKDGAVHVPLMVFTTGRILPDNYHLHFTYFQKFAET